MLAPVKRYLGAWNFAEVSPAQITGRFNGFLKSVIVRISEARDLGDIDRFAFYDHMKVFTAAPPETLRIDEKKLREYSILNCCGVIITSNEKTNGIYLPADDRRHYVAASELDKADFEQKYWDDLWRYYDDGGAGHVAAAYDLSNFNAKAPPPKTAAFWEIVHSSRNPNEAELADVLDEIAGTDWATGKPKEWPNTITLDQVIKRAPVDFAEWLRDRKNSRAIPHRLEACGYVAVRNEDAKDGLWKFNGKRQVIYAKASLPLAFRLHEAIERATERGAR